MGGNKKDIIPPLEGYHCIRGYHRRGEHQTRLPNPYVVEIPYQGSEPSSLRVFQPHIVADYLNAVGEALRAEHLGLPYVITQIILAYLDSPGDQFIDDTSSDSGERETHEEGTRELAPAGVQGSRDPRENAALRTGPLGEEEAVEQRKKLHDLL